MAHKSLTHTEVIKEANKFEVVYKDNISPIHRFMLNRTNDETLSQDLTSKVFMKAWRTRASFKDGSIKAWLFSIAHSTLIDHWRKKKEVLIGDEIIELVDSEASSQDEVLDRKISLDNMKSAFTKLPDNMQSVLKLRFIEGLSTRKTAKILGISEANVRVAQYRALKKLRKLMK